MKIVESSVVSKTGIFEDCEDIIVATNDFAAVIDGATNKSNGLINGKRSGFIAASTLADAIKSLPREINKLEAIQELTISIAKIYKQNKIFEYMSENSSERASASLVIYSDYYGEVWMVGDCQCIANNKLHMNYRIVDNILANTRALYLELELVSGKNIDDLMEQDTGREFIEPILKRQSLFQNSHIRNEYSYGVIDGFRVSEAYAKTIKIDKHSQTLVLASDGYPELMSSIEASERKLEEFLREDPLCIRIHKFTKGLTKQTISYDDRAYLKIEL